MVGKSLLFRLRHLGGDACPGGGLVKSVAPHQPFKLDLIFTPKDDQPVKSLIAARLYHQCRIGDHNAVRIIDRAFRYPFILLLYY